MFCEKSQKINCALPIPKFAAHHSSDTKNSHNFFMIKTIRFCFGYVLIMHSHIYREALQASEVHHEVGVLRYDIGAVDSLTQSGQHVRGTVRLLGVRQNLLDQQMIFLDALDRFDQ